MPPVRRLLLAARGTHSVHRLKALRFSHFLPSLLLLVAGIAAASLQLLNEFFTSLFNVLPTLLLILGGAFCLIYSRQRELFLLVVVYCAYFVLDTQADFFRATGKARPDTALVFHLCSLLLPLFYGIYAAWQERTHLVRDLVARSAVLLAVGAVAVGLAQRYPDGMLEWLAQIRWPSLHGEWMSMVQMAYPVFLLAFIGLIAQYIYKPRPLHAAQLVGLVGLCWMLPKTFLLPHGLNVMSSQVMLILAVAVAHEAYQMAFRDELTGLPGRRALNERLPRLGRNYVIAMADVDHFKKFNDTHGHDVGDQVLRVVASQLRKIGGGGKAYRYGGEEFTLVFSGKTLDECRPHLETVRQAVESYVIQLRDKGNRPQNDAKGKQRRGAAAATSVTVTVSIGVAEKESDQRTPEEVIKAADRALYAAKAAGRNCVIQHGQNRRGAVRVAAAKTPAA